MNEKDEKALETYRTFLLLSEIAGDESLSQRELAKRVGIALGLVNAYLKNLTAKGYIRVKAFPKNRYAYLLTPKGIVEKSRLAYQHLAYFTNLYKIARHDYQMLFRALRSEGVTRVAFCGVDETTEIAYLSMQEAGIELAVVMDDVAAGGAFLDHPIVEPALGLLSGNHKIVITSLKRGAELREGLAAFGVPSANIRFAGDGAGKVQ